MTFISGLFFVFILITVLVYFLTPMKCRWIVLLAASVVFYLFSGIEQIAFIVLSSLCVYASARWMDAVYTAQDAAIKTGNLDTAAKKSLKLGNKKKCRRILTGTVLILLAVLLYCKMGNRVLEALNQIASFEQKDWMKIIVPLGVSYYTFSMTGYLADVYWRKERAETNYFKFALFVFYFPQILQGPIARHKKLAGQLTEGHAFDEKRIWYGIQLAIWGYFKKLVIADRLAVFVNEVFNNYMDYTGLVFVVATLFGSVVLYCDFSGCMDIASGVSEIFGIELEKNFERPFFAKSAAEFWRRWHITLGSWFKDYVYMPLVISPHVIKLSQKVKKVFGSRAGKATMSVIPLACVWLLTGLWHGTGYNYIAWGMYWGGIIIISTVFAPEIKKLNEFLRINTEAGSWKVWQMVRTFLLFSVGRMITLPGHLRTTLDILEKIFRNLDPWIFVDGSLYEYGLNQKNFAFAMFSILILWGVSMLQEKGSVRDRIAGCNLVIRWGIYYLAIFSIVIFGIYGSGVNNSVFTYMNY